MSLPTPPSGFEFIEEDKEITPPPPKGFEPYKPSFREHITATTKELVPGLSRKQAFGILRGAGKVAQEVSGGLPTFEQVKQRSAGLPGESEEDRQEREQGEPVGEFLFSLGIPLGPVVQTVKGLVPKKAQEKLFEFLKDHGFSDKEITPFLQSKKKWAFLKKLAKKNEKTATLVKNIEKRAGGIYETLKAQGASEPGLNSAQYDRFVEAIGKAKKTIPLVFREKASKDIAELLNSRMNNSDFIEFVVNINARIGSKKGGPAAIGRLKKPALEFMKELNPQLASDYKLASKLYGQGKKIAGDLLPKHFDEFIEAGEIFGVASGIVTGNISLLTKALGMVGARAVAREMLINPKLQNISKKIFTNMDKGNKKNIVKLMVQFANEIGKDHPDIKDQLNKLPQPR